MYLLYKTPAIILDYKNIGEADRFYSVFTNEYGLLKIMGRGIRNHYSKLRPNLDILSLANVGFISKKDSWLLIQAAEINPFSGIKSDSAKLALAAGWNHFLLRFLHGPEKDSGLWDFTLKCFSFLNETELNNAERRNFDSYFRLMVLEKLGYVDQGKISEIIGLPLEKSSFSGKKIDFSRHFQKINAAVQASQL